MAVWNVPPASRAWTPPSQRIGRSAWLTGVEPEREEIEVGIESTQLAKPSIFSKPSHTARQFKRQGTGHRVHREILLMASLGRVRLRARARR